MRMRSRWRGIMAALVLLGSVAWFAVPAQAAVTQQQIDEAVSTGGQWLASKQGADGSLPGFNSDWAVTAVAAAGINAADVRGSGTERSLQDFWQEQYSDPTWAELPPAHTGVGQIGKAALIAHSAGLNTSRITPEVNLAATLASTFEPETGLFGSNAAPNALGFALLALPDLGLPASLAGPVVESLLSSQYADGGWGLSPVPGSASGDTDITGSVLGMLCSNGLTTGHPAIDAGIAFLKGKQDEDSGAIFSDSRWLMDPNSPTMAWAITGLTACEVDLQGDEWTTPTGKNPLDGAFDLRLPNGEFMYHPTYGAGHTDNVNATEAMVRALSGNLFSAEPPARVDSSLPRLRPVAPVAPGTEVPVALSIEDGQSKTRLCAVKIEAGASLTDLLDQARTDSIPEDCVDDFLVDAGQVTELNGAAATNPDGGWVVSIEGEKEQRASNQVIEHGAVVSLRLSEEPLPIQPPVDTPDEPSPPQEPGGGDKDPAGTPGPSGDAVRPHRRPVIRTVQHMAGRRVLVARIGCPQGGPCRIITPERISLIIRGGGKPARRIAATVLAPRRIAAGRVAAVQLRLSRPARRVLRGHLVTGKVQIRARNSAGLSRSTITLRLRGAEVTRKQHARMRQGTAR